MASGVFLGSVYASMRFDTSDFGRDVSKAQSSVRGLGGDLDGADKSTQGLTKSVFLGSVAANAFTGAVGAISGVARDAFGQIMNLQNTRSSFEVLTGGAQEASKVMADLASYAKSSPFEFPEIAAAGKTLLGFGISTGDVGNRMRQLGDIAGSTGGDLGAIARVFGQISAAGKVSAEDFNQLIDNGVALGDVMAQQLGIPVSELKDKMAEGAVTTDIFNKSLDAATSAGGKFFGGADKLSQTLTGRISTLKDNMTAMVGTLVGVDFSTGVVQANGAFDKLSQAVQAVNVWIGQNQDKITAIAAVIGGAFLSSINAIAGALKNGITFMAAWIKGFQEGNPLIVGATIFLGVLAAGILVATAAIKTVIAVQKAWTAATLAWSIVSKTALIGPLGLVLVAIAAVIAIGFLIVKNWDTIKATAMTVFGAIGSFLSGVWDGIKSGLAAVGQFFVDTWNNIANFFKQYGLIILAVVAPIIGIPLLIITNWSSIVSFFQTVWTNITTFIGQAITNIISFLTQLPYNLGLIIGASIRWLIGFVTVDIPNFVNGILTWIGSLPGKVAEFFTTMWNSATEIASNMINGIVDFFSQLPGRALAFITALWNGYVSIWTTIINFALSVASNIINGVVNFFSQLPGRVMNFVQNLFNQARDTFNSLKDTILNAMSTAIDNTVNFFKELPGKIIGAISGLGSSLMNKFKDIASSAWKGFKDGLGIHSPSYIEEAFMAIEQQGTDTTRQMKSDMSSLNSIASQVKRVDVRPVGAMDYNYSNDTGSFNPINIENITLPNVQNPQDFARELKLATVGR